VSAADVRRGLARHGGLCTAADLATRWGVTRQRVAQLSELEGFPEPIRTAGGTRLWLTSEADHWRNGRQGRQP
jgi:hypothetical protein